MARPGWVPYFLGIARAVAERADCTRAKHGAVVVRSDNTIASTGFNGHAPGGKSCLKGECPRGRHYPLYVGMGDTECGSDFERWPCSKAAPSLSSYDTGAPEHMCESQHAESNALAFAREDTTGHTLYVTGQPCAGCIRTARAHRIAKIVWANGAGYVEMHLAQ